MLLQTKKCLVFLSRKSKAGMRVGRRNKTQKQKYMGRVNTNFSDPNNSGTLWKNSKIKKLIFLRIECLYITYKVCIHTYSLSKFLKFKLLNESLLKKSCSKHTPTGCG